MSSFRLRMLAAVLSVLFLPGCGSYERLEGELDRAERANERVAIKVHSLRSWSGVARKLGVPSMRRAARRSAMDWKVPLVREGISSGSSMESPTPRPTPKSSSKGKS